MDEPDVGMNCLLIIFPLVFAGLLAPVSAPVLLVGLIAGLLLFLSSSQKKCQFDRGLFIGCVLGFVPVFGWFMGRAQLGKSLHHTIYSLLGFAVLAGTEIAKALAL